MGPVAIIFFGLGLIVCGRLRVISTRSDTTGLWRDPPTWARRIFSSRLSGLFVDDLLVGAAGWIWLITGVGMLVSGLEPGSPIYLVVVLLLFFVFIVLGLAAGAIWFRRETGRR